MIKLDANETRYFARQLELIQTTVYKQEFPELKARMLIPVDFEGGNAILTKTYRRTKAYGRAGIVNNYADDYKAVGESGEEITVGIKTLGDSYGYNIQDIRAAAYMKQNLSSDLAILAKEAIMREEDYLAFNGDSKYKLEGFLTAKALPKVQGAATGTGGSTLWSKKTPAQIFEDIKAAVKKIQTDTLGIEKPDTVLFPTKYFTDFAFDKISDNSDTTILEWLTAKLKLVGVTSIDYLLDLDNLTVDSTIKDVGAFMLYTRKPHKVRMLVPFDFYQFPVQQVHQHFYVDCEERFGGVQYIVPKSALLTYGI